CFVNGNRFHFYRGMPGGMLCFRQEGTRQPCYRRVGVTNSSGFPRNFPTCSVIMDVGRHSWVTRLQATAPRQELGESGQWWKIDAIHPTSQIRLPRRKPMLALTRSFMRKGGLRRATNPLKAPRETTRGLTRPDRPQVLCHRYMEIR